MVERLNQDALPAARIPAQIGARGPGEVTHSARGEAPGLRSGNAARAVRDSLLACDDLYHLARLQRSCQARALLRRADERGIGQRPGRGDEKTRRERETHIEVAELEVEFARAEERQRIPPMHVVEDREARV